MNDRLLVVVGSVLAIGGLIVSALTTRPRPDSVREVAYLALPLAGATLLAALAWGRI